MIDGKRRLRRISGFWVIVWFLGTIVLPVHGAGGKDPSLSQADALIADKRYDDAIQVLTEYIRRNPENFSAAQKRFRQIIRLRDRYSLLANEILDVFEADPGNTGRILDLSRQIEDLDPGGNSTAREFLERIRFLTQFTHNRNRLEEILAKGRSLIDRGDYTEALRTYAEGLDLYRDEFFAADYGEMVEARVRSGLENIAKSIDAFAGLPEPLGNAAASMEHLTLPGNTPPEFSRTVAVFDEIRPALERLMSIRTVLEETGTYYARQLALLQESNNVQGDRSFLSFAVYLIFGRNREDVREGMVGAVSACGDEFAARIENAACVAADWYYRNSLDLFREHSYDRTLESLETAGQFLGIALNTGELWKPAAGHVSPYETLARAIAGLDSLTDLTRSYELLAANERILTERWQAGRMTRNAVAEEERSLRYAYAALAGKTGTFALAGDDPGGELRELMSEADSLNARVLTGERNSVIRFYGVLNGEFEERLLRRQEEFVEAEGLFAGTPREIAEGGTYTARYPAEALALLEPLAEEISRDLQAGGDLLRRYDGEPPDIRALEAVAALRNTLESLVGRLEDFRTRGLAMAATARELTARAEALRLDGDRLYEEARTALSGSNFDVARDRALRSGERYDASLAIQESPSLRTARDSRLFNLGMEITRLENEAIVREVRNLVNSARTAYFAGDFELAEQTLIRAQNRWQLINLDANQEVGYWLTIVRGGLSLRSGRSIPATAPLFAEMSQLLSDAVTFYEEGVRLINSKRRQEGLVKFSEARKKTQEVRLMFPINQEASLLELRIDQLTDPAAFETLFRRRFTEAVAGTRRGSVEAFADLRNLAEINPRFPGIREAVEQAEINMGYRPAPPDARALARSAELTASARAIINGNVRSQFPIALEQLNEALVLNPNNDQAMTEKDRVQTLLGGGGSVVLSNTAERQYQQAVQELRQGNTLVAMGIVQQLLRDPRNRNSTRLLELQRRIEALL
jgi:hypothetical protein